ncbi:hypothetical protein M405DRAFT_826179 [Rhizopogon salebrosus TDB-379]|nr:hypothetical protein M405DRAFT_826179 [Rhizopogon salebrosus TDB-379]
MPMISHPGPLQDLPLAHFLPSGASPSSKTLNIAKPAKRPLSPSKSTIFSPAKRRILRSEGILIPGRSSPSFFHSQPSPSGSDVFGASCPSTALTSPVQRTGAAHGSSKDRRTSRRPSPKLTRQCSSIASGDDAAPALSLRRSSRLQSSQPRAAPMTISREMPPSHNRQSVHYPGFDTYQDTHIFLVPPRRTTPSSDNEDSWSSSEEVLSEREISKENIPPRKKTKKSSLARSCLPIDKPLCSDRSATPEEVCQPPDIMAGSWRTGGVFTHRASPTELPTTITPK